MNDGTRRQRATGLKKTADSAKSARPTPVASCAALAAEIWTPPAEANANVVLFALFWRGNAFVMP